MAIARSGSAADPANAAAHSVLRLLSDFRRQQFVSQAISQARQLQAGGDLKGALSHVQRSLSACPEEPSLLQLRTALHKALLDCQRLQSLVKVRTLANGAESDPDNLPFIVDLIRDVASRYPGDREFQSILEEVKRKARVLQKA